MVVPITIARVYALEFVHSSDVGLKNSTPYRSLLTAENKRKACPHKPWKAAAYCVHQCVTPVPKPAFARSTSFTSAALYHTVFAAYWYLPDV